MAANVPMMEAMNLLGLLIVPEGAACIIPAESFVTHIGTETLVLLISMDITHVASYIQSYKRNNNDNFIVPPSI